MNWKACAGVKCKCWHQRPSSTIPHLMFGDRISHWTWSPPRGYSCWPRNLHLLLYLPPSTGIISTWHHAFCMQICSLPQQALPPPSHLLGLLNHLLIYKCCASSVDFIEWAEPTGRSSSLWGTNGCWQLESSLSTLLPPVQTPSSWRNRALLQDGDMGMRCGCLGKPQQGTSLGIQAWSYSFSLNILLVKNSEMTPVQGLCRWSPDAVKTPPFSPFREITHVFFIRTQKNHSFYSTPAQALGFPFWNLQLQRR